MKFSILAFFSKGDQFPAGLVTFTEEVVKGKIHFLCTVMAEIHSLFWQRFLMIDVLQSLDYAFDIFHVLPKYQTQNYIL